MAISIAKLAIHLTAETAGLTRGFAQAKSAVNGFAGSGSGAGGGLNAISQSIGNISPAVAAAVAAITVLTVAVGSFARLGISFASAMERAKASFTGFLGSGKAADAMLKDLFAFSATTPFEFPEVRDAAKTMIAMGAEAEDVMPQMRMLGEVAAGSGQPLNELANVFGQVMQAGRLTGNELRQFNERGIPVLSELANMLDVPKAKIRELVEAGEISSAQVVEAFARMSTGTGLFAGQMGRQSETLSGQWATFKDNMMQFAGAVMAHVIPSITALLRGVNQLFEAINGTKKETQAERDVSIQAAADKAKSQQKIADAQKQATDQAKQAAEDAKKHMDQMRQKGEQLTKSLRTPAEVWKDSVNEMNQLLEAGTIDWQTYTRGIEEATQALEKTAKATKLSTPDRPVGGVVQGTAAARSAEFAAQNEMNKLAAEAKQQTELAKQAKAQRDAMLAAIKAGKPIDVREVTL
jgi:tape measure domain-containing protein